MNILKYKDYEGTAELDMERNVCRGKLLFISDLVTYESTSIIELQSEFEDAVDDYIDTCKALGRPPKKPLKGQFNVRISPALHKAATLKALETNVSLNDVVVKSLEVFLNVHSNGNIKVIFDVPPESFKTYVSNLSTPVEWDRNSHANQ